LYSSISFFNHLFSLGHTIFDTRGVDFKLEYLGKYEFLCEAALDYESGGEGCVSMEKLHKKNVVTISS
jgi:hypothetical protein